MIEHIKDLRAHLEIEAFREFETLGESHIQVPEARALGQIAAASHLTRWWNAEEGLCARHIAAIVIWVRRVRDKRADVIHRRSRSPRQKLKVSGIIGTLNQNGASMRV